MQNALCVVCDVAVVCDHYDGHALVVERLEQRHDLLAGLAVQRAGRFIRKEQVGACDQRAGGCGALALAVADRVWILENAVYSVVSPEGCASILWKDAKRAKDAAECLRLTAQDMEQLGVVEQVISEEEKGTVFARVKAMLETELDALCEKDGDTLLKERYARFRKY